MNRLAKVAPLLLIVEGISQYVGASLAVRLFDIAPALSVGWGRLVMSGLILLAWRHPVLRTQHGAVDWRAYGSAAIFGTVLGAMNLTFYQAIDHIALGTAVALEFLGPVVLAALTASGWRVRTGIGLACAGVFLISWKGVDINEPGVALGVFFALCAGLMWALYIWLGRRIAIGGHGLDALTWAMLAASAVYAPLGAPHIGPVVADWRALLLLLGVGVLSSALPYAMDQIIMPALKAPVFALLNSLFPVTSLFVGLLMLHQVPTLGEIGGLVLVSVAVALATSHSSEIQ